MLLPILYKTIASLVVMNTLKGKFISKKLMQFADL